MNTLRIYNSFFFLKKKSLCNCRAIQENWCLTRYKINPQDNVNSNHVLPLLYIFDSDPFSKFKHHANFFFDFCNWYKIKSWHTSHFFCKQAEKSNDGYVFTNLISMECHRSLRENIKNVAESFEDIRWMNSGQILRIIQQ